MLYSFFNLGARCGWMIDATLRPLYPRERDPIPILQEVEWDPVPVGMGANNPAPSGIRSSELLGHKESLYRLRNPDPKSNCGTFDIVGVYVTAAVGSDSHIAV